MDSLIDAFVNIRIQDLIDIGIISIVVYRILSFVKQTRAEQLLKGVGLLLVLTKISEWLKLYAVNFILSNIITIGAFAIVVVFQPELRRGLEYLGRSSIIIPKSFTDFEKSKTNHTIESIIGAVGSLSRQQIGALIVLEGETGLGEIIETGTAIDGVISTDLLINIFIPNAPLHDGAVIVRGNKVMAAGAFLPLSENDTIGSEMGTRHRAALGIAERSDALAIVVSEETGTISIAEGNKLSRHLDMETLEKVLEERLITKNEEKTLRRSRKD